jgi:hypothetical protein
MTDHDTIEEVKPAEVPPIVNIEYDTPPKEWVPGTVVPADTAPEDMTNAEYIQWMYENLTPFWAIKKNMLLRTPPTITSIEPTTAAIGDPSFTLVVTGTNFHTESVIVFAGQNENTTLNADGTLSTGVNMTYWHGADAIPVYVSNGPHGAVSEPVDFTFTAAADGTRKFEDYPPEEDRDDGDDEDDDSDEPSKKNKPKAKKKK